MLNAQEDHFPGCQSEVIPAVVPGAPNFRGVPGFNVYGVSLPTVEGIKATLALVGAAPGTTDKHGNEARLFQSFLHDADLHMSRHKTSPRLRPVGPLLLAGRILLPAPQSARRASMASAPYLRPTSTLAAHMMQLDIVCSLQLSGTEHSQRGGPCNLWQVRAVWHNMREEPNVYINGRPYVLREDERPYKNLQEYSGIDYQRLQRMEVRALDQPGVRTKL